MVQGGDFVAFDGTGGYSPMTGSTLQDESFAILHDRPGRVSMANRGHKHTSGSQFFITLAATNHLDGKHVCFGQVVEGMDVVHSMTTVERDGNRPVTLQRIVVSDCGVGKGRAKGETSRSSDKDAVRHKQDKRKKKKKRRKRDDSSTSDESNERPRKRKKRKHRRTNDDSSSDECQHRRTKDRKRRDYDSNDSSDVSREPREKKRKSDRRH